MDVATLTATLQAEIAGFLRNMDAADAAMLVARRDAERLQETIRNIGNGADTAARDVLAASGVMTGGFKEVKINADRAKEAVRDVTVSDFQVAAFKAKVDAMSDSLDKLKRKALEARAASGTGYSGSGLLGGILPGGRQASAGAVTTAIGIGLAAGPAVGAGAAGLGIFGAGLFEGLIGSAGVLKLAFDGMSAKAFSNQKAFDALTPAQQHLVQTLRSLDAGLMKNLESTAQGIVLPGLTKALGAAVTPASVNALTSAVSAFSHAVSNAAQEWGKLLGSSQFADAFGQVLNADARYAQDFFVGLAHITDAFVHLQQAATPLTNWLDKGALAFTVWADNSIKSAQASGELAKVIMDMQQALQALGGLVEQVGRLFGSIFEGIGFQNSIATVSLLAAAFQTLADFIFANKQVIHDLFAGLVASIGDALKVIGELLSVLTFLLGPINDVAGAIGGWRAVFDTLLAFWVAKMIPTMLASLAGLATSFFALGPAAAVASTEMEAALAPLLVELTAIQTMLAATIPEAAVAGAVVAEEAIIGIGAAAAAALPELALLAGALYGVYKLGQLIAGGSGAPSGTHYEQVPAGTPGAQVRYSGGGRGARPTKTYWGLVQDKAVDHIVSVAGPGGASGYQYKPGGSNTPTTPPPDPTKTEIDKLMAQWKAAFGTPGALAQTGGGGGGVGSKAANPAAVALSNALSSFQATSAGTSAQLKAARDLNELAKAQLATLKDQVGAGKITNDQLAQEKALRAAIATSQKAITADVKAAATAAKAASQLHSLGLDPSGSTLVPGVIADRARLASIQKMIATNPSLDTAAVKKQIADLNKILKDGFADPTVGAAVATALSNLDSTVTTHLKSITTATKEASKAQAAALKEAATLAKQAVAQAAAEAKQAAQDVVTAAKTAVSDTQTQLDQLVGQLIAAANLAFDQQTNATVKTMNDALSVQMTALSNALSDEMTRRSNALSDQVQAMNDQVAESVKNMQIMVTSSAGSFLFGGSIKTTPAQDALAALQAAHDADQRTMSLTQAQLGLAAANAGGDPAQIAAARQSLADAQYAIQVAALQKDADTQSTAAQEQLSAAQDAYQKEQQAQILNFQRMQDEANTAYERAQEAQNAAFQDQQQIAIQNYQDARALQKQAMDNQLAELETAMKQFPELAATYLGQMLGVLADNGVDLNKTAFVVGDNIYTGLAAGLDPIYALIDDLNKRLAALAAASAAADASGTASVDPGAGTRPDDRGGLRGPGVNPGGSFVWGGIVWGPNDKQAFTNYLLAHNASYANWATLHPSAAGIFKAADGAYVKGGRGGTLAMVGDGSDDEIIMPLGKMPGGGGQAIEQTVIIQLDGRQIALSTRKHLLRFGRNNPTIFSGNGINA